MPVRERGIPVVDGDREAFAQEAGGKVAAQVPEADEAVLHDVS
jgi:hypothetical protein